jgi:putative membrane protein
MWDFAGHGWGWVGVGLVHMLLFWGLIILAIVALMRFLSSSSKTDSGNAQITPLDILKERLARGEIDAKEFEEKKRLLND